MQAPQSTRPCAVLPFRQKALNVNRDSYPGTIDKALTNNSVNLTTPERLDRPVEP
jgi:hypothetical protein